MNIYLMEAMDVENLLFYLLYFRHLHHQMPFIRCTFHILLLLKPKHQFS